MFFGTEELPCGKIINMREILRWMMPLVLLASLASGQEPTPQSAFDPIKFLVGNWQGTTHGKPGNGQGERHYKFVLRGEYLRASNRTVYPPQEKNPKGEVHEDIGYFSYDKQKKKLILRQFHVEGFVNEYVQKGDAAAGKPVVLETESIENLADGWRARETYKIISQDEFVEVFELAEPQKEFAIYAESRWKRVH
jgi:hypothetical protein